MRWGIPVDGMCVLCLLFFLRPEKCLAVATMELKISLLGEWQWIHRNTRSKKTSECPTQSLPLHSVYDLWIEWNARLYQKRANRMENLLHELKTTVYIRV